MTFNSSPGEASSNVFSPAHVVLSGGLTIVEYLAFPPAPAASNIKG